MPFGVAGAPSYWAVGASGKRVEYVHHWPAERPVAVLPPFCSCSSDPLLLFPHVSRTAAGIPVSVLHAPSPTVSLSIALSRVPLRYGRPMLGPVARCSARLRRRADRSMVETIARPGHSRTARLSHVNVILSHNRSSFPTHRTIYNPRDGWQLTTIPKYFFFGTTVR